MSSIADVKFRPGRPIEFGKASSPYFIEQMYEQGDRRRQWLAELIRNGIQANATKIWLGIWWGGLNISTKVDPDLPLPVDLADDTYRFVYYDNGHGMADIGSYLSQILDSPDVDEQGAHTRFGMGCRVSLLPWNRLGVVVATWTEAEPLGQLVWIARHAERGYSLVSFEFDDPVTGKARRSDVVPADYFPELIDDRPSWLGPQEDGTVGTGTMFLLLGDQPNAHTFRGPDGNFEGTEAFTYVQERFWDLPKVDLRIECPSGDYRQWHHLERDREDYSKTSFSGEKVLGKRSGDPARSYFYPVHPRRAVPSVVASGESESGTLVDHDGTRIHWWLRPDKPMNFTGRHVAHKPMVAVLYQGELYHQSRSRHQTFAVASKDMNSRLTIVVEPHEYHRGSGQPGVISTNARDALLWKVDDEQAHGGELPWHSWGEYFYQNLPGPVAEAMRVQHADKRSLEQTIGERLGGDMLGLLVGKLPKLVGKAKALVTAIPGDDVVGTGERVPDPPGVVDTDDDEEVEPEADPQPPRRRRRRGRRTEAGDTNLTESSTGGDNADDIDESFIPEVSIDFEGRMEFQPNLAVVTNGDEYWINGAHPGVQALIAYWLDRKDDSAGGGVRVRDAIGDVLTVNLACRIAHLLQWNARELNQDDQMFRSTFLTDEALTASLFGYMAEYPAVRDQLRQIPNRKDTAAA